MEVLAQCSKLSGKIVSVSYTEKGNLNTAKGLLLGTDDAYILVVEDGDLKRVPKLFVRELKSIVD